MLSDGQLAALLAASPCLTLSIVFMLATGALWLIDRNDRKTVRARIEQHNRRRAR